MCNLDCSCLLSVFQLSHIFILTRTTILKSLSQLNPEILKKIEKFKRLRFLDLCIPTIFVVNKKKKHGIKAVNYYH
jgi:hypothetical protein